MFDLKCVTGICGCLAHNGFLTRAGYEALDIADGSRYLDKVGSVSALVEGEGDHVFDDQLLENQYRRFLNGS